MSEYTNITEGSKAIMRKERVMGSPIDLVSAIRQYRHNNGDGLLFGFDYDEAIIVFEKMEAELEELRAKAAALDWLNGLYQIKCDHLIDGQFDAEFNDKRMYLGEGSDLLEAVNNAIGDE